MRQMTLVKITNPNPRPLLVWRGGLLQDSLKTADTLQTPMTDDLQVSYAGKSALVVFQVEGDDLDAQEWVQKVGVEATHIHPDYAIRPEAERA